MKEIDKKSYTCVSLFSGAFGLDIGLEQAGIYSDLAIEIDELACNTIKHNRPDLEVWCKDISKVKGADILKFLGIKRGELDILVGGPPCQSFSTAGNRGSVRDLRGLMIFEFLRLVDELKPKVFLMENVRGLLSAVKNSKRLVSESGSVNITSATFLGSVASELLNEFSDLKYRVDYFAVNSVNYGVPQLRERALFFGNRLSQKTNFPEPTHGPSEKKQFSTLFDAIGDLREIDPEVLDFSPRKKKYLSMLSPGQNWRNLPPKIAEESMGKAFFAKGGRSGWWRRLDFNSPAPTIVTMPNHASTSLCHPKEIRALSLRECARVQGFPDKWKFLGTVSQKYKQVGNAVPSKLGELCGKELIKVLQGKNEIAKNGTIEGKVIRSTIRTKVYKERDRKIIPTNKKSVDQLELI